MADTDAALSPASGRRATSVARLSHVGLQLFFQHGFDETTVDDIAAAAGIGRRTFFRYFPSKNDLPWGDFDTLIEQMRSYLHEVPDSIPMIAALRQAVLDFNRYPAEELEYHRERMQLLLNVPTLVAHSTLRYAAWRAAIAEFAARRLGVAETALQPQVIGWAFLAISLAAYEQWLADENASLIETLGLALSALESSFADSAQ